MPKTWRDAVKHFAKTENGHDYLVARRWPNGVTCPRCGSSSVYYDSSSTRWECKTRHPKRTFSLKTGTIFEDSALGLDKWLPCVWLFANAKDGVSSHEIARALDVTQKTAWFMLQRIRLAMQDDNNAEDEMHEASVAKAHLRGHVERSLSTIGCSRTRSGSLSRSWASSASA